jgi:hypothetical protein
MRVHIFRGTNGVVGVTQDQRGLNLPDGPGPWQYWKEADLQAGEPLIGVDVADAINDINTKTYHLTKP